MTLRAIIIDDEQGAQTILSVLLQDYCPNVEVVAIADSVSTGIEVIQKYEPELVFLDIEMPFGSGFDLLEQLQRWNFDVVFTTAYDQHALRAFKVSAIDYLLKPIEVEELQRAVQRVEQKREEQSLRTLASVLELERKTKEKMELLLHTLAERASAERMALPTSTGMEFVEIDEVVRCEGMINYTNIHFLERDPLLVTRTLKEFEQMLEGSSFFRVHNSHLINFRYVVRYIRSNGGQIVMADGKTIDVSRRRRDEFLGHLNDRMRRIG